MIRIAEREEIIFYLNHWQMPENGIMLENTINFPYHCKSCFRDLAVHLRKETCISKEDIRKIAEDINKHNIKTVSFFNLGEPYAASEVVEQLQILREKKALLYLFVFLQMVSFSIRIKNGRRQC